MADGTEPAGTEPAAAGTEPAGTEPMASGDDFELHAFAAEGTEPAGTEPAAAGTEPAGTEAPAATEAAGTAPAPTAPERGDADLVIWADDTRTPVMREIAEPFAEELGIVVAVQEVPSGDIRQLLTVTGPQGEGPDVIVTAHDGIGEAVADGTQQVYDVAHNIAKVETHRGRKVCVHRKGATRAFPAGSEEIADAAAEAAREHDAVVLAHHGCSALGESVRMALRRAVNLEEAATMTYRLLLAGDTTSDFPPEWAGRIIEV